MDETAGEKVVLVVDVVVQIVVGVAAMAVLTAAEDVGAGAGAGAAGIGVVQEPVEEVVGEDRSNVDEVDDLDTEIHMGGDMVVVLVSSQVRLDLWLWGGIEANSSCDQEHGHSDLDLQQAEELLEEQQTC